MPFKRATIQTAANADFLNADLFETAFLKPCEEIRAMGGVEGVFTSTAR
jgi:hypothetical protein